MSNPFTIRIYVPEGDPEGIRIIDRLSSTGIFFAFPRTKWNNLKTRKELTNAGIYILSGYASSDDDLPTIYVGQADNVRNRMEQHDKNKDFWDKAIVFVSANKLNSAHAKWLEYALVKRAQEVNQSILENGNSPQEPTISESERADMQVFLNEIYQTLPLAGLRAFEMPKTIARPETKQVSKDDKDTIIVPAQKDGFDRVFVGQNAWWAIRISGGMLEKIKYIAAYQTAPISAVTHIASVERIEPYGEEGKYKLIFSEPAKELENPIPVADAPRGMMQSIRYTNHDKFKTAKKVAELFE
ncbi:MAG: excinuclease ABC subunit C [Candidatus Yonathbacteria bacterium CG_4_9_14_0_8_um_filter_46_47]|uniref:Excinuclease ABC subunit C n=2 Tax=Patescibacteria group TaxID=1783273 RepID=A0A2M8D6C7_9BACT|nr:MAG: excinuclease ABC subunit C [Candidatus Yonathbacteria bacterium CG23_combo_of_CG06-09_8_20_14_all_46_18]PIP63548.1 MAG: excinuclease ABC subunit C [Candidatus Roizmanbacteria bacterium CG22_combo_CG10-13_8_21_14_all_34_12]PJB82445.1 MAG: excinuclease ABC subunit C [Candidatus Yonathbacteria bacterium CG_4_9_14_0_8_um_filter_46_47]PJC21030.1 MAG: excinuclease ABC subunit C [Candidatus Yonathbacteria bacterium CG_4_9_14_0_2_um_filter_47_74]PJC67771.1 MAG: excinuclease ABC subunit C [Candi